MKAQTVEVISRFLEIVARTAYDTKKPGTAYCDVKVEISDVSNEIISAIETDKTSTIGDLLDILELGKALKLYAKVNLLDAVDEYTSDDWDYEDKED